MKRSRPSLRAFPPALPTAFLRSRLAAGATAGLLLGVLASPAGAAPPAPTAAPVVTTPTPLPAPTVAAAASPASPASSASPSSSASPANLALPGPLSPEQYAAFSGLIADPLPPQLVRNTHYVVSNEDHHDLFKNGVGAINPGGVYVGVGTDQNYVLAGWFRPDIMVLLDFDQMVVDVHQIYRAFFLAAKDAADFRALWEPRNEARAVAVLEAAYQDPKLRAAVMRAYRVSHYSVTARLRKIEATYKPAGVRWFLSDPEQYQYLAALYRGGRVFAVRGDLSVGGAVASVARAATAAHQPVRVVYLSNAERYFPYTDGFRSSMQALPMNDKTIILRTRARLNGAYMYLIQPGLSFQAWLGEKRIHEAVQMTRLAELDEKTGAYFLRKLPASATAATAAPAPASPAGAVTPGSTTTARATLPPVH